MITLQLSNMDSFKQCKFGKGYAYQVIDPKITKQIFGRLTRYYKIDLKTPYMKFNSPLTELSLLSSKRYLAYFKFDCIHSYLYLTKVKLDHDTTNLCFFIHRGKLYLVRHRFSDQCFNSDLLFEGYLLTSTSAVDTKPEAFSHFIINDLLVNDNHTFTVDFLIRLKTINNILNFHFKPDPILDLVIIQSQDFVDYSYLRSFCAEYLDQLAYKHHIKTIAFRPVDSTSVNNLVLKQSNMLKLSKNKNISSPTKIKYTIPSIFHNKQLNFKLNRTGKPDVYELYLTNQKKQELYSGLAHIPDIKTSHLVLSMFKNKRQHYAIVQCKWDNNFKRWQPVRQSKQKWTDSLEAIKKNEKLVS